jgi:hypothetical protein
VTLLVLFVLLLHRAPGYPVSALLLPILLFGGVERFFVYLLGVLGEVLSHALRQIAQTVVGYLSPFK